MASDNVPGSGGAGGVIDLAAARQAKQAAAEASRTRAARSGHAHQSVSKEAEQRRLERIVADALARFQARHGL